MLHCKILNIYVTQQGALLLLKWKVGGMTVLNDIILDPSQSHIIEPQTKTLAAKSRFERQLNIFIERCLSPILMVHICSLVFKTNIVFPTVEIKNLNQDFWYMLLLSGKSSHILPVLFCVFFCKLMRYLIILQHDTNVADLQS